MQCACISDDIAEKVTKVQSVISILSSSQKRLGYIKMPDLFVDDTIFYAPLWQCLTKRVKKEQETRKVRLDRSHW